jgi:hypothetical protein
LIVARACVSPAMATVVPLSSIRIQYTDERRTFGDEWLLLFYAARLRCRLTTKANPRESRGRKATGLRLSIRACAWMP